MLKLIISRLRVVLSGLVLGHRLRVWDGFGGDFCRRGGAGHFVNVVRGPVL